MKIKLVDTQNLVYLRMERREDKKKLVRKQNNFKINRGIEKLRKLCDIFEASEFENLFRVAHLTKQRSA